MSYTVIIHDDTPGYKETFEKEFSSVKEAREFIYQYNKDHIKTNWSAWIKETKDETHSI
jgi:hypothetical protein